MSKSKEPIKAVKPVKGIKFLTGADSINKAIVSLAKRGKAYDKDVHIAAVSVLVHADKHGDITLAQKLVDALPASQRKNALKDWFIAFGKFSYDTENKAFTYNKAAVTQTETAISTPFWEFKPEAAYVPFNAITFLEQAIKRVTNAANKGDNVPAELVTGLNNILAQVNKPDALAA